MNFQFNIPQLISLSNGITYNPALALAVNGLLSVRTKEEYNIKLKEATAVALGYNLGEINQMKDYGSSDKLHLQGAKLFQPLTLKGLNGEADLLLESAVVSFNRQKNILETLVEGRDSSVKEFINNGDYAISVSGIMCERGWNYPLDQVVEFTRFMDRKEPIDIVHEVLNSIGVHTLVIFDHDCPKTPSINCQIYSFNAKSDKPLPLTIDDLNNNQI